MNPKFSSFLFTELVILLLNDDYRKEEIYHELMNRLMFCDIDENTSLALIELEKIIIKNRKLFWDTMLYDKYWWLENDLTFNPKQKKILQLDYSEYFLSLNRDFLNKKTISYNLLTISELISLMDEATYVDIVFENKGNVSDEIDLFKSISMKKSVRIAGKEIYFRIMSAYETAHNNSNFPNQIEESARMFYQNELNILFLCKWTFKNKFQYTQRQIWKSYSSEYFNKK